MVLKKASDQGNASFKNHMYRARCQPKGVSSLRNVHFFYDKKKLAVLLFSFKGDCSCVFGFWISYRMFAL